MCRVASGVGLLTMLRVPDPTRASVLKAAELGPDILDLPMVNAPSTAEEFVRHARFPPLGERGFFGSSRAVRYGIGDPVPDQQQRLNDDLCLLIQVETKAAVGCAADLCRVPGVDGIFLGPGDLSVSFGVPGQAGHPEVRAAMEETVKIAHQWGVLASGACAPSDFAYWADRGAELLFCAGNISCQIAGARLVLDEIGDARMASSKPRLVG
jgi:2-keto-3-deoxy-L-rhamnonate aldolase RhmA